MAKKKRKYTTKVDKARLIIRAMKTGKKSSKWNNPGDNRINDILSIQIYGEKGWEHAETKPGLPAFAYKWKKEGLFCNLSGEVNTWKELENNTKQDYNGTINKQYELAKEVLRDHNTRLRLKKLQAKNKRK